MSAFEYVSPGHVSKFPLFISLSHVDLTENPDAACMYLTIDSTLGRSYALYSERVVCLLSVVCYSSNSLVGFRAKCHSLGSSFSLQPVSIGLPPGDNTVTYFLLNKTVQSALNMGPTPTSLLVKDGMMYPVVEKSAAKCGIGIVSVDENLSTCPLAVHTLICEALFSGVTCGDDGAI